MNPEKYDLISTVVLRYLCWIESILLLLAMTDQMLWY